MALPLLESGKRGKGSDVQASGAGRKPDICYINLDRVPERRAFMDDQFAAQGLTGRVVRTSATDAADPGALDDNGYVPGSGGRWGLRLSEIAVFESHRKIWKRAVDQALPAVAIFEDDVQLSSSAAQVIEGLLAAPARFDLVKLDYSPRALRFGAETALNDVPVRPLLDVAPSAAAYVLSLEGCRKLLAWSVRYSDHLDDFTNLPRPDWRMFQCFPAVGVQLIWSTSAPQVDRAVKISERESDPALNRGLDKGPLWFRLRRELRAAGRKLCWKMGAENRLTRDGGYVGFIPCADDLSV